MSTAVNNVHSCNFASSIAAEFDFKKDVFMKIILTIVLTVVCANAQTVTTIHDFGSGTDGDNPQSGVIFDSKGNIFGTAALGGSRGGGAAYQLTPPDGGHGTG